MAESVGKRKKSRFQTIFSLCIVLLYTAVIFVFSSQNGIQSNRISGSIAEEVKAFVIVTLHLEDTSMLLGVDFNAVVRKTAHILEYMLLTILVYRALLICRFDTHWVVITSLFCFISAFIDEFHQLYIPQRTSSFRDILVDLVGGGIAMLSICIQRKLVRWKILKRSDNLILLNKFK